jgi:hypothetical protein
VEAFGVYCPETRGVYLVPIADIPSRREGILRVADAKNNQKSGIRLADIYLVRPGV